MLTNHFTDIMVVVTSDMHGIVDAYRMFSEKLFSFLELQNWFHKTFHPVQNAIFCNLYINSIV